MSDRPNTVAAVYAVLYATVKDWLRGFYGPATKSIASGIVCGIVALNLWSILLVVDQSLASTLIVEWRNWSLVAGIIALSAVDLAFVETGKADQWASVIVSRGGFLNRHRSKLMIALIAVTSVNFIWAIQPR